MDIGVSDSTHADAERPGGENFEVRYQLKISAPLLLKTAGRLM